MKKIGKIFISLFLITLLCACNNLNYTLEEKDGKNIYTIKEKEYMKSDEQTNLVLIDIKNKGALVAELYPEIAPITVENFKKLISENYYNGLTFHRVIKDFMIQTGDPTATGRGGTAETIKGEFELNKVKNDLSHTRGVLSMARLGAVVDTEETMNSASSQFFIVHKDSTFLDGKYAAFGKVIEGLEIIDDIANTNTDEFDKPITDIIINKIIFLENK